jgi:serine/threonine protein kinase
MKRSFIPKLNLVEKPIELSKEEIFHNKMKKDYQDISKLYIEQKKLKNERNVLGRGAFKEAFVVIKRINTRKSVSNKSELFVAFDFKYPYSGNDIKEISNFIKFQTKQLKCSKLILCPIDIGIVKKNNDEYIRLVVSYFEGITLEKFLKQNKCKGIDELKIEIMLKLIDALKELSNKWKYIHYDIKPANIMININNDRVEQVALIDLLGGCFMDAEECKPMSTAAYSLKEPNFENDSDEINVNINPDIYSMALVFRDMIGLNQFKCDKKLTPLENDIYNITKNMISGKFNLDQVHDKLYIILNKLKHPRRYTLL